MKITALIALLANISLITAVVIKCNSFKTSTWWASDPIYECEDEVLHIYTEKDRYVTDVEGFHHYRKSHNDVNSLWIHRGQIDHFPRHIEKFFPKLIGLIIEATNITEIHSEDLKPFPELIRLNLEQNHISVLEKNLFIHNRKLIGVGFNNNRIIHVDSKVFDGLVNLMYLHFLDNNCYSGDAKSNRFELLFLIWNIKYNCVDMKYELE